MCDAAKIAWPGITEEKWEEARHKLAQQLSDGEMTCVLAAQRFTPSMERQIRYMNHLSTRPRFYAAELVRFVGNDLGVQVKEAFECRVVAGPKSEELRPRDRTHRMKLLEGVSEDRYREALERILDHAESQRGLTFNWGAAGVSIRLKTPWQASPATIAWLYPPDRLGLWRLTDLTLGYVNGGVNPRISGEQRASETTRCRAGHQEVASRQAASRLLRCAPALRMT